VIRAAVGINLYTTICFPIWDEISLYKFLEKFKACSIDECKGKVMKSLSEWSYKSKIVYCRSACSDIFICCYAWRVALIGLCPKLNGGIINEAFFSHI